VKNADKVAESARKTREKNRQRIRAQKIASQMKRRALQFPVSREAQEYIPILRDDPCVYCGQDAGAVDHIDALHVGGSNDWENLTATCRSCNSSKRTEALLSFLLRRRQG
jgi:5-methylcytosine-specific restriction endonuclease McrA